MPPLVGAAVQAVDDEEVAERLDRALQRPQLHGHLLDNDANVERAVVRHLVVVLVPAFDREVNAVNLDDAAADGVLLVRRELEVDEEVLRVVVVMRNRWGGVWIYSSIARPIGLVACCVVEAVRSTACL